MQIFYCDKCNYASKFLAKVKRHQVLIHRSSTSAASEGSEDRKSDETAISDSEDLDRDEKPLTIAMTVGEREGEAVEFIF